MQLIIRKVSRILQNHNNLTAVYALVVIIVAAIGLISIAAGEITFEKDQLYPKTINPDSPLNPYDRGGSPFVPADIKAQYPGNFPAIGYITGYLSPFATALIKISPYFGTTIVAHPGGILDEILYATRGLDTIVETSILFVAFTTAMFLFRRDEE
ncbi:DUF2106 family protein [Methanomicrobium mobile]|uniref:DUF2106 family protein n=1 Tax=Methanomicrobium mobile TaxID=2205 RepID=UPI0005B292DA|nr:DUF2106 family protein [Methanomicrobium mobile]